MPCLPRIPRLAAQASRARADRWSRAARPARGAAGAALAAVATMAIAACSGGAIGQDDPASGGQSFVSGSYATTVYAAASRPVSPDIKGTTLTGAKLALSAYHGDILVMNFWGSWCSPCRQEAPALAALARHFQPSGVRFLGVDIRDSPAAASAFIRNFRISYPSLNDPSDDIALAFQSTVPPAGIPTTLVIDRKGRVAARIVGQVTYSTLGKLIAQVEAQPS
ncbi:MAG: TlpA disulfide reductase family protein [Actinomycetota bacterium]